MPSTQHDALVWLSGVLMSYFRHGRRSCMTSQTRPRWRKRSRVVYRTDRDLTGFIDGSENPTLLDAPVAALLPEGVPGAAGTVLLLQKWKHKVAEWEALPLDQQERIMGRTKLDSIELENKAIGLACRSHGPGRVWPHLSSQHALRKCRRPWHMFVGFSADQKRLSRMLDSMAGLVTGTRDALTRFTQPLTGSYYFVPSRRESAALTLAHQVQVSGCGCRKHSLYLIGRESP